MELYVKNSTFLLSFSVKLNLSKHKNKTIRLAPGGSDNWGPCGAPGEAGLPLPTRSSPSQLWDSTPAEAWSDLKPHCGAGAPSWGCWFPQPASGHLGLPVGLWEVALEGREEVSLMPAGYCCWVKRKKARPHLTKKVVPAVLALPGTSREDHPPWHGWGLRCWSLLQLAPITASYSLFSTSVSWLLNTTTIKRIELHKLTMKLYIFLKKAIPS